MSILLSGRGGRSAWMCWLIFSRAPWCFDRVDTKLLEEVQEYDAVPSEAASYGKTAFWDERYAADEEVRQNRS